MEISAIDSPAVSIEAQVGVIQERLALLAAHRVLKAQKAMGEEIIALLDPNAGRRFDRRV